MMTIDDADLTDLRDVVAAMRRWREGLRASPMDHPAPYEIKAELLVQRAEHVIDRLLTGATGTGLTCDEALYNAMLYQATLDQHRRACRHSACGDYGRCPTHTLLLRQAVDYRQAAGINEADFQIAVLEFRQTVERQTR